MSMCEEGGSAFVLYCGQQTNGKVYQKRQENPQHFRLAVSWFIFWRNKKLLKSQFQVLCWNEFAKFSDQDAELIGLIYHKNPSRSGAISFTREQMIYFGGTHLTLFCSQHCGSLWEWNRKNRRTWSCWLSLWATKKWQHCNGLPGTDYVETRLIRHSLSA